MAKNFIYIQNSEKFYKKLKQLCSPLLHLGVSDFFYQSVDSNGYLSGLGTKIDLLNEYFETEYSKENPLFNKHSFSKPGCFLPITFKHNNYQNFLKYLDCKFQISFSTLVLKKEDNRTHQYLFYCPARRYSEVTNLLINEQSTIQKFIEYFNKESLKLRQEIYENPDDVKRFGLKPANFALPLADFGVEKRIDFLKKIHFFSSEDTIPRFSKREHDCIKLTLQGQTMVEMAETLDLSPRTIENYLSNLKFKLNCFTKSELILKLQKIKEIYPLL